jgi:hypothetical protein
LQWRQTGPSSKLGAFLPAGGKSDAGRWPCCINPASFLVIQKWTSFVARQDPTVVDYRQRMVCLFEGCLVLNPWFSENIDRIAFDEKLLTAKPAVWRTSKDGQ